jgi:hypothetical protein
MKMDKQYSQPINQTVKKTKIPKVVFIDDGINPNFVPETVYFDCYVVDGNEIKRDEPIYEFSHGTKCYEIFRNKVQTPYLLVSIKVLNNTTGTGTHKAMLTALLWCAKHDVDLINMSMGTCQFSDFAPVVKAVNNLSNTLIVAACSNSNTLTFPACLPTVIGVRYCKLTQQKNNFIFNQYPYDQIDLFVFAKDISISDYVESYQSVHFSTQSNSLAAPIITARLCDYFSQGYVGLDAVRQKLKADSTENSLFADYGLYKSLLHEWEDLSIPIVALLFDGMSASSKLSTLLDMFIQNGYRAIALTNYSMADAPNLIFRLEWHGEDHVSIADLIKLYYNFALPDILFLHMDLHSLFALPKNLQPDIVIAHNGNKSTYSNYCDEVSILELDENEINLFTKIRDLLS